MNKSDNVNFVDKFFNMPESEILFPDWIIESSNELSFPFTQLELLLLKKHFDYRRIKK